MMSYVGSRNRRRSEPPTRDHTAASHNPADFTALDAYFEATGSLARIAGRARRASRNYFTPEEQTEITEQTRRARRALGSIIVKTEPVSPPSDSA